MVPIAASLMAPMAFLLIKRVASLLMNAITGKGVKRAGKGQEGALTLMIKVLGKAITRAGKGYNNTNHMDKHF